MAVEAAQSIMPVHSARALLGEGAVWVAAEDTLYWLDIHGRRLLAYRPEDGAAQEWPCERRLTALAPCRSGGFIAGTDAGLVRLAEPGGPLEPIGHPEPERAGNRCNDGKVDPYGHFWLGTMHDAEEARSGALYRIDADLSTHRLADDYMVTNGPTFSRDGRWLYHTDSADQTIFRASLSPTGELGPREVFVRFDERHGYPDGMTTDAHGHLWVAFWDGWCIRRIDPEGAIVAEVAMPVQRPTTCAFGGEDLATLFVTSARTGLSDEALAGQPDAGSLFALDVGVAGMPPTLFPL